MEPVPYAAPDAIEHVQLIAGMPAATCEVIGLVSALALPGGGDAALAEPVRAPLRWARTRSCTCACTSRDHRATRSVSGDPAWEAMLDDAAGPWQDGVRVSGEAVRFREPIVEGRRYLVVGRIGVTDRAGHEHEALERLASRARSMRADLVIDIEVTSQGADRPFEVHGTAIRFIE